MATIIFIAIVSLLVLAGITVWGKTDWRALDEYNQQFYGNGYHIYYDRKIIREIETNGSNH
ncbi:MAG: hypothetical protein EOM31_00045 [Bacteroidia bacterium]|nr:hypothetical protein [Bacteroidia bacterium]